MQRHQSVSAGHGIFDVTMSEFDGSMVCVDLNTPPWINIQ